MKQQTSAATETKIKGRNIIDFTGKTICVGIDTHEKDYQVATVINGICLGNHRMLPPGKGLLIICGRITRELVLNESMKVVPGDLLYSANFSRQALIAL